MKALHGMWLRVLLVLMVAGAAMAFGIPAVAQDGMRAKALALEQQQQNVEAEQIWHSIVQADPRNAEAFAHMGLLEARQEHYNDAVGYYRQALALNPAFPGLDMNLGLALFKANRFKEAIKPFGEELRKHPGDTRLTILLGMSHYGMGDYLVAIPYLKRASEKDPQSLPLRLALAHSCLWSKQYQCVMDVYKEILALNVESAEAYMLAGEALDGEGDTTGAIEQFRAASRANPNEPNVHFGLGYLLWTQSQFAEAAKEFQAELDNDPQQTQARDYLGDCYVQLNDYAKALPELVKAVAADPALALTHRDLGIVYVSMDRKEEAVKELLNAISLDPKDVTPHWQLARLYKTMGQQEEAKAEFTKASTMLREKNQSLYKKLEDTQRARQQQ